MGKHRKTLPVNTLVTTANRMLAAPDSTEQERRAVGHLLESVLINHDCYLGYGYQPGVLVDYQFVQGVSDETRRVYFDPSK